MALMEAFKDDVVPAVRSLGKRPGLAIAIISALALGMGASSAVFNVIYAAVLRPLPFPDPDQLMVLSTTNQKRGTSGRGVSLPDFRDWQQRSQSFAYLAVVSEESFVLTGVEQTGRWPGARVSRDFFTLFGLQSILGGIPAWNVDSRGAVLSHRFWRSQFGGDRNIVGRDISLDDQKYTVVAVMPPALAFPKNAQIWLPLDTLSGEARSARFLSALGRLRRGATRVQAESELRDIARQLEQAYPDTNQGYGVALTTLHERLAGDVGSSLTLLLAAIGFVLLIICANVASLFLARGAARAQELQVRTALGATRRCLIRQLLIESMLLALAGGAVALLVGMAGSRMFIALYPDSIHGSEDMGLGGTVLGFHVLLVCGTGLLCGLVPAFQVTKRALATPLREGASHLTASVTTHRTQAIGLMLQVAVTLVLLFGAGLLLDNLARLQRVDPGFRSQGLLTARILLPSNRYDEASQRIAFFSQLFERLGTNPAIDSAAAATHLPMSGSNMRFGFSLENSRLPPSGEPLRANYRAVSTGYFRTMGVAVLQGRDFARHDEAGAPPVAIVNHEFVQRFWPDEDALGQRLRLSYADDPSREVIGVVGDMRHFGLERETQPEIYVPYAQHAWPFLTLALHTSGDPMDLVATLRSEVAAYDKDQPVDQIRPMTELLAGSIGEPRFYGLLMGALALLAFLTAVVGVYGLNSYWVSLRVQEAGVRVAMGARSVDLLILFVRRPLSLALLATALGAVASFALSRLLTGTFYGVTATDPGMFAAVSGLLILVTVLASYLPARHTARQDPTFLLHRK